tara:strand:- start:11550 stop:12206 length:657 start_codon:yes stop_codon:yes gene_type:complete
MAYKKMGRGERSLITPFRPGHDVQENKIVYIKVHPRDFEGNTGNTEQRSPASYYQEATGIPRQTVTPPDVPKRHSVQELMSGVITRSYLIRYDGIIFEIKSEHIEKYGAQMPEGLYYTMEYKEFMEDKYGQTSTQQTSEAIVDAINGLPGGLKQKVTEYFQLRIDPDANVKQFTSYKYVSPLTGRNYSMMTQQEVDAIHNRVKPKLESEDVTDNAFTR